MPEKEQPSSGSARSAEAYYWVALVKSGECSEEQRAEFDAWLAHSPRHRELYREVSDTWDELNGFVPSISVEIAEARAYAPKSRRRFPLAMAAAVFIILAAGVWLLPDPALREIHRTAKGEQKEVHLTDGSRILINTDTELHVRYSKRERMIRLEHGEALFTVASGDDRPFDVMTRGGRIRDVSTEFSVRRDGEKTSVVVLDGMVIVIADGVAYPQPLNAGEGVSYRDSGQILQMERVDAVSLTAWKDRQLVLRSKPLEEVAKELARYHDVKILLEDDELSRMKVSGVFDVSDLQGLLDAIEVALPVSSSRNGRAIMLSRREVPVM